MKILHVLGATEDDGGILTVLRNLDETARAQGGEQVVLVNSGYRESRRPSLHYRTSRHLRAEAGAPGRLGVAAIRALPELRRLVTQERPDVVHVHTRGALPLVPFRTWCGRAPWVVTFHAYAKRVRLYRWLAQRRGLVTTVLTPRMAQHYGLVPSPGRVEVISECCADRLFEVPLVERRETRPGEDPVRLVGLGSVIREKNWHLILEAVLRLEGDCRSRVRFHHYGPTPQDPEARAYAAELGRLHQASGLHRACVFHGPASDVEAALRAADWFVLPSTNEPCSVALIEALALGLPALVSASGGNLDIVRPGQTGCLFAPKDVEGLTDSLRRVVRGEVPSAEPAEIRESVRERRASAVAAEYQALYDRLVSTAATANPARLRRV